MTTDTSTPAPAGTPLNDAMLAWFKADDWPFTPIDGQTALRTRFKGDNGSWPCIGLVREQQQEFIFYSICETNAPEAKRPAIAEFITRANYGMWIGNFEMDYNDGEIRYKTSIDVEGDDLSPALMHNAVYANVSVMDRYMPGIMSVIFADAVPADAIKKIEG